MVLKAILLYKGSVRFQVGDCVFLGSTGACVKEVTQYSTTTNVLGRTLMLFTLSLVVVLFSVRCSGADSEGPRDSSYGTRYDCLLSVP